MALTFTIAAESFIFSKAIDVETQIKVSLAMSAPFHFKQFSIFQESAPFKVGTDAVLLGCWAPILPGGRYVDVGTGTGVLTCMMAQRGAGQIIALESDLQAVNVAKNNFHLLPFSCHISLMAQPLEQTQFNEKVDGVICNPPYFLNHTPNPTKNKMAARHADAKLPQRWSGIWDSILKDSGTIALVLPFHVLEKWEEALLQYGFFPQRKLWVKSVADSPTIRVLGIWGRTYKVDIMEESMYLYEEDKKTRSRDYDQLTADFYL